jgi:hypothetical protein
MPKLSFLLAGAALLASTTTMAKPGLDPEARLARALQGRVAGAPVDCITLHNVHSTRVIDHVAIIYDAGGTLYVNRPTAGLEGLNDWDVMVTRTPTSRLCNVDVVHLYDRVGQMQTGTIFLGDFVPYKRVRTASAD